MIILVIYIIFNIFVLIWIALRIIIFNFFVFKQPCPAKIHFQIKIMMLELMITPALYLYAFVFFQMKRHLNRDVIFVPDIIHFCLQWQSLLKKNMI